MTDKEKKQETKETQKPKESKEQPKDHKDLQIEELICLVKKVHADFENYKKRADKEKKQFIEYASEDLVKDLLPILDSFELALKHDKDNKGIEQLYSQLWQLLSSRGLSKVHAAGKKFSPFLHEVLLQESSDKEEGIVLEELQAGYMFKERVIRPTKVKVSKK